MQGGSSVAIAIHHMGTPLDQDGLLGLFKGDAVGRGVVLEPASFEDMCGGTIVTKPSLEVIYDTV